jgi:hypothetical protein
MPNQYAVICNNVVEVVPIKPKFITPNLGVEIM